MSAQISKPVGVLGAIVGLVGFSALAGVLVTAMITPALAVTSMTAKSTVGIFEDLPEFLDFGQLSERNTLFATQGGVPVPFAQVYDQNRQEVEWEAVSQFVKDAAVAGEDQRFFEHGGVDLAGIARAAVNNISSDDQQGASTLTQQLVKNLLIANALNEPDETKRQAAIDEAQENSLNRKLKEAKLAIGLEKRYTKQQILLGYLNIAGYGGNTYGIESAAQQYYSTTALNVTLAQAASLVAIVQQPNLRSPGNPENWERNQTRRDAILKNMLDQKKIDQAQYDEAIATPVNETTVLLQQPASGCQYATAAKHFCDYVVQNVKNLESLGGNEAERLANWKRGGYDIYTTIDLDQQANAEALIQKYAPAEEARFPLGAATTTVQVGTGRIMIMAQNKRYDATASGDPATTSVNFNTDRDYGGSSGFQPGSAYKLFTLVNWLQNGHGLQEIVDGNQKTYTAKMLPAKCSPGNVPYPVKNDGGGNGGQISVSQATARSVNAAFASMASKLDLCDIRDTAISMGVHRADGDDLRTIPSMILGVDEIAPMTMALAYATVAGGGIYCAPIAVDKIVNADGAELVGQPQDCHQAIAPEVAAAADVALQGVMRGGTGGASNPNDGTPLIGKTGTADAFHTWIMSASTKVATAVWVGNISGQTSLRRISVGGMRASEIRHAIMKPMSKAINASAFGQGATKFPDAPRSLLNGSSQPVPNVTGQSVDAARKLIESLGLRFVQGPAVASELPTGRVVSTNPGSGALVAKGSAVEVSTSDGTLATIVPETVGKTQKDGVAALAGAGFDPAAVKYVYAEGDPASKCSVTASTPAAGATTSKASPVTLTVNGGKITPGDNVNCS